MTTSEVGATDSSGSEVTGVAGAGITVAFGMAGGVVSGAIGAEEDDEDSGETVSWVAEEGDDGTVGALQETRMKDIAMENIRNLIIYRQKDTK